MCVKYSEVSNHQYRIMLYSSHYAMVQLTTMPTKFNGHFGSDLSLLKADAQQCHVGGLFWFRWKAHLHFLNIYQLKQFRYLERFSHKKHGEKLDFRRRGHFSAIYSGGSDLQNEPRT